MINEQPQLFWGVIASMWIGNAMLVILNLPLVGLWVSLLKIPYRMLVAGDRRLLRDRRLQRSTTAASTSVC